MYKWTEIEQYRHMIKYVQASMPHVMRMTFRGTVKMHGTNIGISRVNGQFEAQSRRQRITPEQDLYGFATRLQENLQDPNFVNDLNTTFDMVSKDPNDVVTLYGEYVGPGIQSNVAVSQLPTRNWIVFGARVNETYVGNDVAFQVNVDWIHNIFEFQQFFVDVDFTDPAKALDELQGFTLQVEQCCPVAKQFGVEGVGEGIVWSSLPYQTNTGLMFKTKGEKHSGKNKTKRNVASVSPERMKTMHAVVEYVLPEGRLLQGLENVEAIDFEYIGSYLKWINQDVLKEELDTIEANDLDWKDVVKPITSKARAFFMDKINSNI